MVVQAEMAEMADLEIQVALTEEMQETATPVAMVILPQLQHYPAATLGRQMQPPLAATAALVAKAAHRVLEALPVCKEQAEMAAMQMQLRKLTIQGLVLVQLLVTPSVERVVTLMVLMAALAAQRPVTLPEQLAAIVISM
jgi:hypothetical protein